MRPGGLTALAIFNFVFGGLSTLLNLGGLIALSSSDMHQKMVENAQKSGAHLPSMAVLYGLALFALARAGLLITSGIGYIKLKRFIGRALGNAYAALALLGVALELYLHSDSFNAANLLEFIYPLITLFLLNVIFPKDFVN